MAPVRRLGGSVAADPAAYVGAINGIEEIIKA